MTSVDVARIAERPQRRRMMFELIRSQPLHGHVIARAEWTTDRFIMRDDGMRNCIAGLLYQLLQLA